MCTNRYIDTQYIRYVDKSAINIPEFCETPKKIYEPFDEYMQKYAFNREVKQNSAEICRDDADVLATLKNLAWNNLANVYLPIFEFALLCQTFFSELALFLQT